MKFSKKDIAPLIIGLLLFLQLYPFFYWNYVQIFNTFFSLAIFSYFWINIKKGNFKDVLLLIFLEIILLLAAIGIGTNPFGIILLLLLGAIPFVPDLTLINVYKYFRSIYTIVITISIIIFLLVLIGMPIPSTKIAPINTLKDYSYYSYPFLLMPDFSEDILNRFRFHGPFDEPGVVGTISLMILYVENFNLKSKQNLILLVSGLLSFSLFFYLSAVFFAIVTLKRKFSILFIAIVAFLSTFTFENEFIKSMIWDRLSWDQESGSLTGDNRTSYSLDMYYESIKGTQAYYWGGTSPEILTSFSESASYKNAVLAYGFITCLLYVIFFLLLAFIRLGLNKRFLLFSFLLLGTLYQRPGFFYSYFLLLFSMFIVINSSSKKKCTVYQKQIIEY